MRCVRLVMLLLGVSLAAPALAADKYPSHPVHWLVGFAAGGPTDIVARIMAEWLSDHLGQQFVIENRTGSGGMIAANALINSPPDGYTIMFDAPNNAIGTSLYKNLPFVFLRDTVPVAGMVRLTNIMVVPPSLPVKTVAEFIAHAKANPGALSYASSGNGTSVHMSAELFKAMAGVDLVHVPYRGSAPAITDLIGGQVQVMFDAMVSTLPQIQSGRIRALAVTSSTRSAALPDVPAIAETVPGYEAIIWFGVGVPRGTPTEVVAKLNREINAGLTSTKMRAQFSELGSTPIIASPGEFWTFAKSETEKWEKVIRQSGAKID